MHFYFKIVAWLVALLVAIVSIVIGVVMLISGTSQTLLIFILITVPAVTIAVMTVPLYDVVKSFDERLYFRKLAGGSWTGVIPTWHIMQFSDMSTIITPKPVGQDGDLYRMRGLDVYRKNEYGETRVCDGEVSLLIPSPRYH